MALNGKVDMNWVRQRLSVKGKPEYIKALQHTPFSAFLFDKKFPYCTTYIMDIYIPSREFNNPNIPIDSRFENSNRMIYDFKDGSNSDEMAERFIKAFESKFGKRQRNDYAFVPIPASSTHKNEIRYNKFCEKVSTALEIENGMNYIKIKYDRSPFKGNHGNESKIENLEFNQKLIQGKTLLLFDDVITSGKSFQQVSSKLKSLGAKQIFGFCLAQTKASY